MHRIIIITLLLTGCESTVGIDGQAQVCVTDTDCDDGDPDSIDVCRWDDGRDEAMCRHATPWEPPTTTPDHCICEGEYLVDNTLLQCLDGVDGTRIKVACHGDGSVEARIGPVTLQGEHTGEGMVTVMGEAGCVTAVLTLDVGGCERLRGHWHATGCGCDEDWPIYAIPAP